MFWNRRKPAVARNEPRDHHYVFAHHVFRKVCARDPLDFFGLIASPERDRYLAWIWTVTAEQVGRPVEALDPAQLRLTTGRVAGVPAIIVTMPAAEADAEAHMVAVLLSGMREDGPLEDAPAFRYFTLERGTNLDGTPRTVLCEWTEEAHRNHGDGPQPSEAAFVAAIEARLGGGAGAA